MFCCWWEWKSRPHLASFTGPGRACERHLGATKRGWKPRLLPQPPRTLRSWKEHLPPPGWGQRVLASLWALRHHPGGTGRGASLFPGKGRGLGFADCSWGARNFYPLVFFWRRGFTDKKVSVLLGCPFPGPLGRERKLLLSCLLVFLRRGLFQLPVQGI